MKKNEMISLSVKILVIQLFFVNIKLLGVVDWHWMLVFFPVWIIISMVIMMFFMYIPCYLAEKDVHDEHTRAQEKRNRNKILKQEVNKMMKDYE